MMSLAVMAPLATLFSARRLPRLDDGRRVRTRADQRHVFL
jgi:hypothetical protein